MSTMKTLKAEPRTQRGSRACALLRQAGRVPAVIYGHKQDPVDITVDRKELEGLVKSKAHLLSCEIGPKAEPVLLKDVQWDFLGDDILHVDLFRVDLTEKVNVMVPIEVKGTAKGTLSGGVMLVELRQLEVVCTADKIPDLLRIDVTNVELGQSIHVRDLPLPEGVSAVRDGHDVVLHVGLPKVQVEVVVPGAAPAQTVIEKGKKEEEGAAAAAPAKK